MLADPDEVKEVFTAPAEVLHPGSGARILEPLIGRNSVILLDEDAHLAQRRLMLPAFHGEQVARLAEVMAEVAAAEVERWPRGEPVALHPRLQALDARGHPAHGLRPRGGGAARAPARAPDRRPRRRAPARSSLLPPLQRDLGPALALGPVPAHARAVDAELFALIDERRRDAAQRDDVLSLLLAARHEDGSPMSPQELRDELMTLLVAGHETTASQLAFAFERLVRTPDVLARLTAEVAGGDGDAYLTATVQETLRRRPVLPNAAPRLVMQEIEVGGLALSRRRLPGPQRLPRPPRPGDLPRPLRLPPRALPRAGAGHLHVDPLRRRTPALPRRGVRHRGDEGRPARGPRARRAARSRATGASSSRAGAASR